MPHKKIGTLFFFILSIGFLLSCEISPAGEKHSSENDYYAIMFLIDALPPQLFNEMINNGELPNIKKYVYDRGLMTKNMVSVFPSISAPAISTIFTGVYPGKHKIPGFQWYNRKTNQWRSYIGREIFHFDGDLKTNSKLVFDYFSQGETESFGIISGTSSGTDDSLLFTSLNPFHEFAPQTSLFIKDLLINLGIRKKIPSFIAIYEWGVDHRGHRNDIFGKKVRDVVKKVDKSFGTMARNFEKRGILDKTYFIILSDHGLAKVNKNFYIDRILSNNGFQKVTISYNLGESYIPFSIERYDSLLGIKKDLRSANVIVGSNAGGCAMMYFVKNGGYDNDGKHQPQLWKEDVVYSDLLNYNLGPKKGYVNVIDLLKNVVGIDFFVVPDNIFGPYGENKVRVISAKGSALISRIGNLSHNQTYKYEIITGSDPLGYNSCKETKNLIDGKFHSGKEWLIASQNSNYPDACVQLTQVFDTTESGTVLLSCADTWSVNAKVKAKHGGYHPQEMRATFCVSGPGLKHGIIDCARIADITPSILYMLNKKFHRDDFDGEVIPQIKEAVNIREQ